MTVHGAFVGFALTLLLGLRVHSVAGNSPLQCEGRYTNPILRGSYPDPSIVRVGSDYYMVSSSFEYFPGLPIHHSKDLVNWELIGYGLNREEQLEDVNLRNLKQDDGIQAATIRHHNGTFYIVTTSVNNPPTGPGKLTSFIITASDPRGPWSKPHVVKDAVGIDPSLLFDDDGKVWYTANNIPDDYDFMGQAEIWVQELNITDFQLTGQRHSLTRGACGGVWVEGPHIYKAHGRYYLLTAEGGTGFHHAVMIAVSDKVTGPYTNNPRNPILTMRHASYSSWVGKVGHMDIVELQDGRWFAVALGVRGEVNRSSNMGRESHLVPMIWEEDSWATWESPTNIWPVVSPETGRLEREYELPLPGKLQGNVFRDDFDSEVLHLEWNYRRFPNKTFVSLSDRPGFLRLQANPEVIADRSSCSVLGVRQWESSFTFRAQMHFQPASNGEEAGVMLFQKDDCWIKFTVLQDEEPLLRVVYAEQGVEPVTLRETKLENFTGNITFHVEAKPGYYEYSYTTGQQRQKFHRTADTLLLYVGYTGNYLGLYATSNGGTSGGYADFDFVEHVAEPKPCMQDILV